MDEKKETAVAFLHAAVTYHQSLAITVSRVMPSPQPLGHPHSMLHARDQRKGRVIDSTSLRNRAYAQAYRLRSTAKQSCHDKNTNSTGTASTAAFNTKHPSVASKRLRITRCASEAMDR